MEAPREQVLLALGELERELQTLGLWSRQAPTATQMASTQPFCVDTMAFEHWLQWVFIPRMRVLLEHGLPMPGACRISAMGEQSLLHLGRRQTGLLRILARIDRVAERLG